MTVPLWSYDLEFTALQAKRMKEISGETLVNAVIRHCVKECKKKGIKATIKAFKRAKKELIDGITQLQAGDVRIRFRVKEATV